MKYRTRFEPPAPADLRAIDRKVALTMLRKLAELETDPYAFDTTEMVYKPGVRRLRVGNYRVWYTIEHDELVVLVIKVGHRRDIYDR